MGREIRMVPPYWVHPKDDRGRHIPMFDTDYELALKEWKENDLPEWEEAKRFWDEGFIFTYADGDYSEKKKIPIDEYCAKRRETEDDWNRTPDNPTFDWWMGDAPEKPKPEHYMPQWTPEEATHYMMYENTSEGTPISPAFATPEELARWLADTGASSFADLTANYEQWLATIKRGWAVSAIMDSNGFRSGVEAQ